MKTKNYLSAMMVLVAAFAQAQLSFTDATSALQNTSLKSGVAMVVTDMSSDGLDDIVRLDNAQNLEIEYQQEDGTFLRTDLGATVGFPWALTVADVDANGYNDILTGGTSDGLKLLTADATGSAFTITTLNGPNIFLQNANFVDINNDGAIDFFGCHDDGLSSPYRNDGAGILAYDLNLINAVSTVASDNSGNYGSIWMDYDNDGDLDLYISKCRQGVNDPMDGRRLNLLFQNDGDNNFIDVAEAAGLRPQTQTWSTNFEDIDNDGDLDAVIVNHFANHQIFTNNGDGTFTDSTTDSGIETALETVGFGIQVMMEDFDNNGFIDIYMTTTDGQDTLFLNTEGTFAPVAAPFTRNGDRVQSAAVGDLNNDGFMDIIAGYASGFNNPSATANDQLFLNDGNDNNWFKLNLEGVESNYNGIGARIELYGEWGMQIREVRAGESYGTQNSLSTHFGIATATEIEKAIVRWPSGIVDQLLNPDFNTVVNLREGDNELSIDDTALTTLVMYPNPAANQLYIAGELFSEVQTSIYDIHGRLISKETITPSQRAIDISRLAQGVYFLNINDQKIQFIKK